jgi:pentatricopeptide repeat protein
MATSPSYDNFANAVLANVWEAVGTELALLSLFCAGFTLFRVAAVQRFLFGRPGLSSGKKKIDMQHATFAAPTLMPVKQLEANWAAGHADVVLSDWKALDQFSINALKAVVEALVATQRENEVNSTVQRILAKHGNMRSKEAMTVALEAVSTCLPQVSASVRASFNKILAKANYKDSRNNGPLTQAAPPLSPEEQAHVLRITKAVQSAQVEDARQQMISMHGAGHCVPTSCVVAFVRTGAASDPERAWIKDVPNVAFTADVIVALLEHTAKTCSGQMLNKVRDIHHRAEELSLLQAPQVCEAILRSYATLGHSRAVEVFDDFVSRGFAPSEGTLTGVISLCAESRHVQMAEHVLQYARRANVNSTLSFYAAMVKVYAHSRLFNKICSLYEIMLQDGVKPDTVVYGALIKAAVESGRLELARKLFRESGNPDLLNYMSLIRAAGREKDLPKALELLDELEAAPLAIDATAYNCVLEVCVASGNRAAAAKLLERMQSKGQVDVVSYNTYMKLLFTDGTLAEADTVLESMRAQGLSPNAVTYNSLIKDAVNRQDLDRAWALIARMEAESTSPDAFTCSILMKGVKHTSSSEDVDRIVSLMRRTKVTPDEVLVNCLLDAYVRLRNIPRLVEVLEEFKSTGVVPSLHACALLIKAYGHSRRLDCAWALWRELSNERKTRPNEEVFASMVDACLAAGDLENAVAVFREMKDVLNDFPRSPVVFAALVKACLQRKQTKLALEIYEEVQEISFTCNRVTYNTILDILVRQGDMDKASSVFQDMSLKAVTPDLISYATLIKGHCSKGCLEQGLQLLGLMQRRGISPDAIVFNSILDGCAHKQMRTLTEQVLKDMETAGIAPSNFTLSILVKLYGRCQDLDAAFHVVNSYPERYNFKLNAQVYTCLMSACIANGTLPKALGVYEDMIKSRCAVDAKMYQTLLNGCLRHGDLEAAARLVRDSIKQKPPLTLDQDTIDGVLFMMSRRGRGQDLAIPLLSDLDALHVRVSERVRNALCKSDAPASHQAARRRSGPH